MSALPDIRNTGPEALRTHFQEWRQPAYRVEQLLHWLYARRAASWDEMSNLPRALRGQLAAAYALTLPQALRIQGADDTTRKFLWRLTDGSLVESVLIPANPALYGDRSDRHTLCISTQVGCAYGCRFCASGLDGWKRNLQAHEILGQVLAVERWNSERTDGGRIEAPRLINNIVVMGMGEPMANYAQVMDALRTLNAPWGGGIGARKITLSTSGVVPGIRKLAEDPLQFRLAISLHGATDEVRDQIMPVNRKHPLADLTAACRHYVERKGKMITLEYILIAGVNADPAQAVPLATLAQELHAKVNLIPYNRVEGLPWERPAESDCHAFAEALRSRGVTATLRLEKGHDIDAACGQLRLRTERELSLPQV
ncbi:MAG: 23S rRNA (adenine(2503)-C(2))-methyltransferase RlmN [Verrucomicrobia bacterium]|nr:23S rRNA (adenine(2503)-C(2))-methyltransferase RlmN [Verrucomicrobiota bacterium]